MANVRALISFMGASPSWPHLVLTTSQSPQLLISSHCGVGRQHMNLGRIQHAVHNNPATKRDKQSIEVILKAKSDSDTPVGKQPLHPLTSSPGIYRMSPMCQALGQGWRHSSKQAKHYFCPHSVHNLAGGNTQRTSIVLRQCVVEPPCPLKRPA